MQLNHFKIGCTVSNLQVVDYALGLTGYAYDALAFMYTREEFGWTDSTYTLSHLIIPTYDLQQILTQTCFI